MECAKIRVFKKSNNIGLRSFLEGTDSRGLHLQIWVERGKDFTNQSHERLLPHDQFSTLLISSYLLHCNFARTVSCFLRLESNKKNRKAGESGVPDLWLALGFVRFSTLKHLRKYIQIFWDPQLKIHTNILGPSTLLRIRSELPTVQTWKQTMVHHTLKKLPYLVFSSLTSFLIFRSVKSDNKEFTVLLNFKKMSAKNCVFPIFIEHLFDKSSKHKHLMHFR